MGTAFAYGFGTTIDELEQRKDAANRLCGEPMYRGQYACKSCVVKDSCQVRKWYELLEKVRDGK